MIFIYTWIFFIFFLSVFLNGYLYKKYDDVISMLGFKKKIFLPLEIVSLKVLKNSKDERVKKVYIIILLYKIIYFSAIAFFWIYIIIKNLE